MDKIKTANTLLIILLILGAATLFLVHKHEKSVYEEFADEHGNKFLRVSKQTGHKK